MKNYLQLLIEKSESLLDKDSKDINTNTVKRMMFSKYGKDAFLDYEHLRYPVMNPETGDYDCKVIYNSYLLSAKDNNDDIKEKASVLLTKFGCPNKLKIQLNEAEIKALNELKILIFPSIDDESRSKINDEEVTDKIVCQCIECGYCCELSNTYTLCTEQLCPVCDSYMDEFTTEDDYDEFTDDEESENDPLSNLLRNMLDDSFSEIAYPESILTDPKTRFICNECKTSNIIINESSKNCPKCKSKKILLINETTKITDVKSCPRCNLNFSKETCKSNTCTICNSYLI